MYKKSDLVSTGGALLRWVEKQVFDGMGSDSRTCFYRLLFGTQRLTAHGPEDDGMGIENILKEEKTDRAERQTVTDIADALDGYVAMAQISTCLICGDKQDLRMGVCFDCSDRVSGYFEDGCHVLRDTQNPKNVWRVKVDKISCPRCGHGFYCEEHATCPGCGCGP